MRNRLHLSVIMSVISFVFAFAFPAHSQTRFDVGIQWSKVERVSQTTPTLQVVVNPPLRRGTPVHDNAFKALQDLCLDYVRYVPWLPYPKLGVAELEPPKEGKPSWDFSFIDRLRLDFPEPPTVHSVILNLLT